MCLNNVKHNLNLNSLVVNYDSNNFLIYDCLILTLLNNIIFQHADSVYRLIMCIQCNFIFRGVQCDLNEFVITNRKNSNSPTPPPPPRPDSAHELQR